MTLRCIVADDEPLAKMLIENYILRTPGLELAGSYTSAAEANRAIETGDSHVAFLDIQMPGMNGLQLARTAEKAGVRVVFTTAYRDYAVDGFRLNALDYLLKPVSYDEFLVSANRAIDTIANDQAAREERPSAYLTVRSNYRSVIVDYNDIIYIEGLRDYVKIHLANDERPLLTQMSMKLIAAMLPDEFVRIHRSYIVRLDAVVSYTRTNVDIGITSDGEHTELPLGHTFRDNFFERIHRTNEQHD